MVQIYVDVRNRFKYNKKIFLFISIACIDEKIGERDVTVYKMAETSAG